MGLQVLAYTLTVLGLGDQYQLTEADQVLTLAQIENLFQSLTASLALINVDPNSGVSTVLPTGSAPSWGIDDDVIFLRITITPEAITQMREVIYQQSQDGINLPTVTSYIRVHTVNWICYGPNSFANADLIRDGIASAEATALLAASNLALILDRPPPVMAPALFNGQWWSCVNLEASFNELAQRFSAVPAVAGAQITIASDDRLEEVIT